MTLRLQCPYCRKEREHPRGDVLGDWIVCTVCELPFAWRDATTGPNEGLARRHEQRFSVRPAMIEED